MHLQGGKECGVGLDRSAVQGQRVGGGLRAECLDLVRWLAKYRSEHTLPHLARRPPLDKEECVPARACLPENTRPARMQSVRD
jgi:hypothetical protein